MHGPMNIKLALVSPAWG